MEEGFPDREENTREWANGQWDSTRGVKVFRVGFRRTLGIINGIKIICIMKRRGEVFSFGAGLMAGYLWGRFILNALVFGKVWLSQGKKEVQEVDSPCEKIWNNA